MINSAKKIKFLCLFTFFIIYFFFLGDYIFAEDDQIPKGKPFEILQKQIDDLNLKFDLLFGQSCSDGEFMTGFDTEGNIVCRSPDLSNDIFAYGMGLSNHMARSYLKITQNTQQTTYIMGCQKSGTDPFNAAHANFELEFDPPFFGAALDVIAVEIPPGGNSDAFVELKNVGTGDVLATSNVASTSQEGWIVFSFTPNFIINQSTILVHFVTENDAGVYNCANTVKFIPE